MNFIEWTTREEDSSQSAANPRTIKTKQERDRLTRMEATLNELLLRQVIAEAKAFQPPEKNHAKQH
jgi:hypothetical protein